MLRVELDRLYYSTYFWELYCKERPVLDSGYIVNDWLREKVIVNGMYQWCGENMDGKWKFYINNESQMQIHLDCFYFEFILIEDAAGFKLRWV